MHKNLLTCCGGIYIYRTGDHGQTMVKKEYLFTFKLNVFQKKLFLSTLDPNDKKNPRCHKITYETSELFAALIIITSVKFNHEIDIVQFLFTRCVVYSFGEYCFLLFHSTTKNINDCLYIKDYLVCNLPKDSCPWIYLTKVNYTSYNYTSYKSTWTSPFSGSSCLYSCWK